MNLTGLEFRGLVVGPCLLSIVAACGPATVEEGVQVRTEDSPALTEEDPAPSAPRKGLWHPYRPDRSLEGLSAEQRAEIAALEAIGYADGKHTLEVPRGVTRHDPERTVSGVNLLNSAHVAGARLIDMQGRCLHTWSHSFRDAWPDYPGSHVHKSFWRRTHLFDNGDLLCIFEGMGIIKIDKDSKLIWASPVQAHHDLQPMPDGTLWVLTREAHMLPRIHERRPSLEDFLSLLDSEGRELRRISVLEALEKSEYFDLWDGKLRRAGDLFHTNSLEILTGSIAHVNSAFAAGNFLISLRTLDLVAVLDPEEECIVWATQGTFKKQHDPAVLANGHLLLFDNNPDLQASSVLELDVGTGEEYWRYEGRESEPFFSSACGLAQRLPGGNTLITETDYGRAFEVTPEGDIVWEYYNPFSAGENDEFIATMMEMWRLPADMDLEWVTAQDKETGESPSKR